jgi:hypothetical protein
MALKVLLDECVSAMHGDRESSLTDRMPLPTLEYKVSHFCKTYSLTISFVDGIMSK